MISKSYISLILVFWIFLPTVASSQIVWEQIPLPDSVKIISFEVGDNGALYVGAYHTPKGGVYKSSNNGVTWENIGLYGKSVYNLEFANDNQLFETSSSRIFKYLYDDLWEEKIHMPTWQIKKLKYLNTTFFGGGYTGIIRSVDEGENWESVLEGNSAEFYSDFSSITEDSMCAVCTNWVGGGGGVYLSGDNGDNWTNIGLEDFYLRSVAVDCTGNILAGAMGHFYTGQGGLYRYNKSIGNWDTLLYYPYIHSIEINENNDIYLGYKLSGSSDGGGVMHSENNGETWILDTIGIDNSAVDEIIISGNNYLYAMGGYPKFRLYKSSIPVNVNENQVIGDKPSVICYPNPATTNLTITFDNQYFTNNTIVSLSSIIGETAYKKTLNNSDFENGSISIDVSSFKKGTYIASLNNNGKTISSNKIIITN